MACPEGASIKRVLFDSYGLPIGGCGTYGINPECHCTSNTIDWIGQNSVMVKANNNMCGNPCAGIS